MILQAKLQCFLQILHILVRLVRNARNLAPFVQDLACFLLPELTRILQVNYIMQDLCKINTLQDLIISLQDNLQDLITLEDNLQDLIIILQHTLQEITNHQAS